MNLMKKIWPWQFWCYKINPINFMKADSSKKEDENTQQSFDKQASNYA
jgi:hypothetical protein